MRDNFKENNRVKEIKVDKKKKKNNKKTYYYYFQGSINTNEINDKENESM